MYQPSYDTDMENENFLTEFPLGLIEEAIRSQFNEPLEYRKNDYVENFLNSYNYSKTNAYEEEEENLEELHTRFLIFIKEIFYDYLSIGMPNIEDLDEDEQHKFIHYTYRFFMNNIKKNFVNLIYNTICEEKDTIYNLAIKKKDVISLNFKQEISDEYDILVLSNLSDIVDFVLEQEYTIDSFFDLIKSDSLSVELEYVKSAFENFDLTGNFTTNYISMVDGYFRTELESKIKSKILKKYPKRKLEKVKEIDSDDEVENPESIESD